MDSNEPVITKEQYDDMLKAQKTLCGYCTNNECDNCIVVMLVDQAYEEAVDAGIIEDE